MTTTHEYPTVDATADVIWSVLPEDNKCAVPRDHNNCAVAQAIKRAHGIGPADVRIHQSVAYVLLPCDRKTVRHPDNKNSGAKEGELAWHRHRIPPTLGRKIRAFDNPLNTTPFPPGHHRFKAPTASQTLAAKARRPRRTKAPGSRSPIAPRNPWLRDSTVRLP
jgi:hypothetical protein